MRVRKGWQHSVHGHIIRPDWGLLGMDTVSATEFKAKCLNLLDQVGTRQIGSLSITKHGKVVAVLMPPPGTEDAVRQLHGLLHGTVMVPEGVDLTASMQEAEEFMTAELPFNRVCTSMEQTARATGQAE